MSFPRYPEYKHSGVEWLGEVPTDWVVVRLNTIATCNDEVLLESTPEDYEIEYVEISGVQAGQGIVETAALPFGNAPSRARRVVRDGDVLVSTVRTYLRAIAQVKCPPENMIASTGFAVLRPRRIDSRFLGYACHAEGFVSEVIARSVGVSYPAINASELTRLPLPLPTTPEQTAIATFLDRETAKIDALVAEQEKLIALLQEKRQAVISHAVTKGLDPNVPMKDSGVEWLGEVPGHWRVARLGYFATVENGTTPARDVPEYWLDGEIPWLASGEVNKLHIFEAEEFITQSALKRCSLRLLPIDTVVVGLIGQGKTRGMSALLRTPATINQNLAAVCPGSMINSWFLLYVFHAMYDWLREAGRGGNQAAMNCEILRSLLVPVPNLDEQTEIVAHVNTALAEIDELSAEAASATKLLQERRTALISSAVTGQIDVRGIASPEAA